MLYHIGFILENEKSKQTAEGKQTADLPKNNNFSYLTTLYCINKAISATIHKMSPEEHQLPSIDSLGLSALARKNRSNV